MFWSVLRQVLPLTNEILTAGIVIVAVSMLLYNLARGLDNWVSRTAGIVLSAVTVVYLGDVVIALGPSTYQSLNTWLRLRWIGIALVPAALFHLSHVLLSTTGRISRWRRRLGVSLLYGLAIAFMGAAATTDQVVNTPRFLPVPHIEAGPWFPVYVLYALSASALALFNVTRARARCLTHFTRRRMTFILVSIVTPIVGVFPYTTLINPGANLIDLFWLLVTLSNIGVIVMLSFMAYPLSFFGGRVPDRIIKAELLEFFLRGPFVGIATLAIIIGLPRAGRVLGMPGDEMMPLAAVGSLILLEWAIGRVLPTLEDILIYGADKTEMQHIRDLNARILTRTDIDQLLEGILASACDYLQVTIAFIASTTTDGPVLEQSVGGRESVTAALTAEAFNAVFSSFINTAPGNEAPSIPEAPTSVAGRHFWLIPLWQRANGNGNGSERSLFGVMAVQARSPQPALALEEARILEQLAERAGCTLRDMRIQAEIFKRMEQLVPEVEAIDQLRWITRYRGEPGETAESIVGQPEFASIVKEALGHYWGGPRLTESELLNLRTVQEALPKYDHSPANALRAVLLDAIERLQPEGKRSMTAAEWTLYNILEMRFIQGRKVRDVAKRLAISESDLYRKQRVAINALAQTLSEMEQDASDSAGAAAPDESSVAVQKHSPI
ncbi:MAG: hypothetical protein JXB47_15100 [Anaerolineae bacterium]|nr:hypothetical protein [Anaerolineae bacterium]